MDRRRLDDETVERLSDIEHTEPDFAKDFQPGARYKIRISSKNGSYDVEVEPDSIEDLKQEIQQIERVHGDFIQIDGERTVTSVYRWDEIEQEWI